MELYNNTCFECSRLITNKYSTSFSQGINAFDKRFRNPVYAIYGFVRFADEIVDTFHQQDKHQLINEFKEDVFNAIHQKISLNPVLHSFQLIVNQYQIEEGLITSFLKSMTMDIGTSSYTDEEYKAYIHGSAQVIGLMCLRIFCENNKELYQQLTAPACSFGSALQKINFLRDICSDYQDRGRIYFPGVDFNSFTEEDKSIIEADIQHDFDEGLKGIKLLPKGARLGVYIAYAYYRQLLKKIHQTPAKVILQKRIRISGKRKTMLYFSALMKQQFKK